MPIQVQGNGATLRASTCNDQTDFDTAISLYSGDCVSSECMIFKDNDPKCSLSRGASALVWESLEGEVYHLFVQENARVGQAGNFVLTVEEVNPEESQSPNNEQSPIQDSVEGDLVISNGSNDICDDALDISRWIDSGRSIRGSTVESTIDFDRPICNFAHNQTTPDVYFKVTGNGKVS